jgi:hypothetical protein
MFGIRPQTGRRGRDRLVAGNTITYAISEFESLSWRGVLDFLRKQEKASRQFCKNNAGNNKLASVRTISIRFSVRA